MQPKRALGYRSVALERATFRHICAQNVDRLKSDLPSNWMRFGDSPNARAVPGPSVRLVVVRASERGHATAQDSKTTESDL
jgi:hypothetical protein